MKKYYFIGTVDDLIENFGFFDNNYKSAPTQKIKIDEDGFWYGVRYFCGVAVEISKYCDELPEIDAYSFKLKKIGFCEVDEIKNIDPELYIQDLISYGLVEVREK